MKVYSSMNLESNIFSLSALIDDEELVTRACSNPEKLLLGGRKSNSEATLCAAKCVIII